jgi:hypothetical protein
MIAFDVEAMDIPIDMDTIRDLAAMVTPHCRARHAAWMLASRDHILPVDDAEVVYNIDATDAIRELIPEVLR